VTSRLILAALFLGAFTLVGAYLGADAGALIGFGMGSGGMIPLLKA